MGAIGSIARRTGQVAGGLAGGVANASKRQLVEYVNQFGFVGDVLLSATGANQPSMGRGSQRAAAPTSNTGGSNTSAISRELIKNLTEIKKSILDVGKNIKVVSKSITTIEKTVKTGIASILRYLRQNEKIALGIAKNVNLIKGVLSNIVSILRNMLSLQREERRAKLYASESLSSESKASTLGNLSTVNQDAKKEKASGFSFGSLVGAAGALFALLGNIRKIVPMLLKGILGFVRLLSKAKWLGAIGGLPGLALSTAAFFAVEKALEKLIETLEGEKQPAAPAAPSTGTPPASGQPPTAAPKPQTVSANIPATLTPIPDNKQKKPEPPRPSNVPADYKWNGASWTSPDGRSTVGTIVSSSGVPLSSLPGQGMDPTTGRFSTQEDFIREMTPYAQQASAQLGGKISPDAILSQWALESNWGKSTAGNFNYFGIKAGGKWKGKSKELMTTEYLGKDKVPVKIKDAFREYDSPQGAVDDYVSLLKNNPRYADVLNTSTPEEFGGALKKAGYATAPHYQAAIMQRAQQIEKLRGGVAAPPPTLIPKAEPAPTSSPQVKKGDDISRMSDSLLGSMMGINNIMSLPSLLQMGGTNAGTPAGAPQFSETTMNDPSMISVDNLVYYAA